MAGIFAFRCASCGELHEGSPSFAFAHPWHYGTLGNFSRYLETWDEPDETDAYFAWLCNRLPHYPDTLHLKAQLRPRSGGTRPFLELGRDGLGRLTTRHLSSTSR